MVGRSSSPILSNAIGSSVQTDASGGAATPVPGSVPR